MKKLLKNPAQIVTVNTSGRNEKKGKDAGEIGLLENHSVIIEAGLIKDILPSSSIKNESEFEIINVKDKTILPGLVECHTHSIFAGSRANEFREKLAGTSYEEIAKRGGGINSTVTAVRNSSLEELIILAEPRVENFISQGVTALEIKSGYGLNFENEIKMLLAIQELKNIFAINFAATFLGAHTFPNDLKNDHEKYVNEICDKMIPYLAENKLAEFCDGFCETTAFSPSELDKIFAAAVQHKLKIRLHTDQFNSIGGIETALKYNAVSVDHLEVMKDDDINKLKNSGTAAVLLPGVSFFLNYQYAPARKLIDSEIPVALSTDFNPGSSHIHSLHFIMSLAALKMKMTIEETISAVTINAAKVLGLNDKAGSIEINKHADFAVFNTKDFSDIVYTVGENLNCMTIKSGEIIYSTVADEAD